MDRLDCSLKGNIQPHDQAKNDSDRETKILLGKQSQTFFHQAAEKITWSGRPTYPPENRRKKLPDKQGKSFLKQKNLSLNRKTSPCTEK